jgi:hypothetical protein
LNRLTAEERRRIRLAQQRAREATLLRLETASTLDVAAPPPDHAGLWRLAKAAMIATLLGGGFVALQALEFNPPASLVEALLPRL